MNKIVDDISSNTKSHNYFLISSDGSILESRSSRSSARSYKKIIRTFLEKVGLSKQVRVHILQSKRDGSIKVIR